MMDYLNKKTPLAGIVICLLLSLPVFGQSEAITPSKEARREAYPVPEKDDVVTTFGNAVKTQLPSKRLSFLVWNLFKGAKESFKVEFLALSFNKDIVVTQEAYLNPNMTSVFSYFPFFFHTHATSFFMEKERYRTGVSTVSSVKPSFTSFVRTGTLEPVVKSPKVTLITRYPIRFSNKELTIVNIHSINFVANKNFRAEIERIYQAIKNFPPPMVFTGDFNTWNQERLDILDEYSKKLGLTGASFYPDHRMTFNGNPLDHFLHSADIKILSAKVDGFYQGSDHKPLEVEVEFQ